VPDRSRELEKTRRLVTERLTSESERLLLDAAVAAEKERAGERPRDSSDSLHRKAVELDHRLRDRLDVIDRQLQMSAKPPRLEAAALVLPIDMVEGDIPADAPIHAKETKTVERRGVDLVMVQERKLGRNPVEQSFNNEGFDILSGLPDGSRIHIEVKARIEGAKDFFISHSEVLTGKNTAPRYRLALVKVSQAGPAHDEVRYLDDPFATTYLGDFDATGVRGDWAKQWAKGAKPF